MHKKISMTFFSIIMALALSVTMVSTIALAKKPIPVGQVHLPGNKIPQFVDPLPVLSINGDGMTGIDTIIAGADEINLKMLEFRTNMMPSTFVPKSGLPYDGTWVFGYWDASNPTLPPTIGPEPAVETNVAPVIVATRNVPTQIRYVNNLTADNIYWRDWIDQSLHSAFHQAVGEMMPTPGNTARYEGPVPAVPHLHGGEVPAVIDGGPEAWFMSDVPGPDIVTPYAAHGPAYYTGPDVAGGGANPAALNEAIYRYPNSQEAGPLWFHDHLLGGTRINATFAGLAGAYLLTDPDLNLPAGLTPAGLGDELLIPLVIQDRMFDTDGQLFFPNVGDNPEHPYWVPEFAGDTIIVNGKVWPYLTVDQKRYRFFIINGSNSRPYDMFLQDTNSGIKLPMWVIATDGGYLDSPVLINPNATGSQVKAGAQKSLNMMPGERYEIIIDFAGIPAGTNLVLRNTAPTVYGNPKASTTGRIMQFRVSANAPVDTGYDPASGTPIRSGGQQIVRLVNPATGILNLGADLTRELTLNEVMGANGPLEALVNNSKWAGHRPDGSPIPGSTLVLGNYLTEISNEGDMEVWEIVNTTADSHPIHLHGLQFQIMNRQPFDMGGFMAAYNAAFVNDVGAIDPMTLAPYPDGVFIPGYGPPLDINPSVASGQKYGGNPDVTPYLLGIAAPPLAHEVGWKDTAIMHPGDVTRIAVRVAPQDEPLVGGDLWWPYQPNAMNFAYVWHCHITDHEDNEMMRPDQFLPNPAAARTYILGTDY
jgi:FtsP/CotA-like multicopper oxidase with cupredoxin domain